jgi:hypothetical protein
MVHAGQLHIAETTRPLETGSFNYIDVFVSIPRRNVKT